MVCGVSSRGRRDLAGGRALGLVVAGAGSIDVDVVELQGVAGSLISQRLAGAGGDSQSEGREHQRLGWAGEGEHFSHL